MAAKKVEGPKIGDMVVYKAQSHEEYDGVAEHPAVVTRVWGPEMVNVKVFFGNGPVEDRTSCNLQDGVAFY